MGNKGPWERPADWLLHYVLKSKGVNSYYEAPHKDGVLRTRVPVVSARGYIRGRRPTA